MILSYDIPDEDSKSQTSESSLDVATNNKGTNNSIYLESSKTSSSKEVGSNLFVFDPKYSKTFSKNKIQNDEIFYKKLEHLRGARISNTKEFSSQNDSEISVKEDNFINTDVLNLLNSSNKQSGHNSSHSLNLSSMIEEELKKIKKEEEEVLEESESENNIKKIIIKKRKSEEMFLDAFNLNLNLNKNNNNANDEKNISLDGSIVSDVSQNSRNFIPKDLIFKESPYKNNGSMSPMVNETVNVKTDGSTGAISPNVPIIGIDMNEKYTYHIETKQRNSTNLNENLNPNINKELTKSSFFTANNNMNKTNKYSNSYINNWHNQVPFRDQINENDLNYNNMYDRDNQYLGLYNSMIIPNNNMYHNMNPIINHESGDLMENFLGHTSPFPNRSYSNFIPQSHPQYVPQHMDNQMNFYPAQNSSINKVKNTKFVRKPTFKNMPSNNYYDEMPISNENKNGNFVNLNNIANDFNIQSAQYVEDEIYSSPSVKKNPKNLKQINYADMNNEELAKNACSLAKEQTGCRYLQKKIDDNPSICDQILFPAVYSSLLELMIDGFGNYLIQKIIENVTQENLEKIIKVTISRFLSLGLNSHGTRVIQKIIECIKSEKLLNFFLEYFHRHMLDFIKDINGNHIIIKFVNTFNYPTNHELYKMLVQHIVEIATHKHACCAFQKCIDAATDEQKRAIIEKLVDNTYILMSDPYGNYVLQYIIMLNDFQTNFNIASIFKNNICYLSKQKFSSNVIEKCFDHCDENTKFMIVKEVCNPKIVQDLLMDMYGNYVLQKALACARDPYYTLLINSVGPHLEKLKTVNFGSKLYTKLLLTYPELNTFLSNINQTKGNKSKKNSNGQNKKQKTNKQKSSNINNFEISNISNINSIGYINNINPSAVRNQNFSFVNIRSNMNHFMNGMPTKKL